MPTINVSPASATVTTTVSKTVASNVCGDIPPTIPVNIDCSLCAIGFPQAGGQISISFYGPICPPSTEPSPSYWLGSSPKMAPWKCPNPGMNAEPNPNKWVATGFFSGISGGSCSNQYKFEAELNAISTTQIIVSVKVYVLTPTTGGATWTLYVQFSEVMTEIPSMDSTSYRSRAFASTGFMPISVNQIGGKGDPVSYYKMVVGLESMRIGCSDPSTGSNAVPDVCGMWDGSQWLSCIRGFIKSTANTAIREFTQLGFNASGCGTVGGIQCDCDSITLTGTSPLTGDTTYNNDPVFVTDYGVLGIAGGVESIGVKQEVQVAKGTAAGIQVVVKSINQIIYICTNNNGAGWICSTATVAQSNSPRILTATRATFVVYLYALNFPNPEILPIECYTPPVGEFIPFQMETMQKEEPVNEPVLDQTQIRFLNRMRLPCIHLGQSIEGSNRNGCGSCHKYICRLHGECRKIDPSNEVRQCVTCEDYFNG